MGFLSILVPKMLESIYGEKWGTSQSDKIPIYMCNLNTRSADLNEWMNEWMELMFNYIPAQK